MIFDLNGYIKMYAVRHLKLKLQASLQSCQPSYKIGKLLELRVQEGQVLDRAAGRSGHVPQPRTIPAE